MDARPAQQPVQIHTVANDPDPDADPTKLCFAWVPFFGGQNREYPPATVWNQQLLTDLQTTKEWILEHRKVRRIVLSGNRRLSASLALGSVFSAVSGFSVVMMYRGSAWATDAHPQSAMPAYPLIQAGTCEDARGDRLVVSIGIIRDIADDVESDLGHHGLTGMPILHLKGASPIFSPEQANLIVRDMKERMSKALQVSLSRLNHWLPRGQAHPEVVQGTTEFHDQIADAFFPQADAVFDDATTLDTTLDMLDPQPPLVERLIRPLLRRRELLAARFLGRHEAHHLREREREEAQILSQPALGG